MRSQASFAVTVLLVVLAVVSAQSTQGWMLGPDGLSCDEACPRARGSTQSTCSVDSMTGVNSPALFARVKAALDLTDFDCLEAHVGISAVAPYFGKLKGSGEPVCAYASDSSSCAASEVSASRLCCCGGPCSLSYAPKWISAGVNIEAPLAHWTFDGFVCFDYFRFNSHRQLHVTETS